MWSDLKTYIRSCWREVACYFTVPLVFALILFLSGQALETVLYAWILSGVPVMFLLASGFFSFRKKYDMLSDILREEEMIPEHLPKTAEPMEALYQKLILELIRQKREVEWEQRRWKSDMADYYTLWAHQIKTPISAMHLILQTESGESARELDIELFKIEQYADMALQYIRLGSETNDLLLTRHDLDKIVRQAVKKHSRMFIGQKISLDYRELNRKAVTDEKWLSFVLEQVISNALKYTGQGGKVSIYPLTEEEFVIEDCGIGIRPEDLPRIFEKGYTGYNGRMDKKATGLGLYLCKQFMDRLGHTIRIESEPGTGTRVMIGIPRQDMDNLTKM